VENPLYVSHDGLHSYQYAFAGSIMLTPKRPFRGDTGGMKTLVKHEFEEIQVFSAVFLGTKGALTNYGRPTWEK
jgi:hypothetical protein